MIFAVMGVSGSGKSTIGSLLADALGCDFLDADILHSRHNLEKLRRSIPLTDADRAPWLAAIRSRLVDAARRDRQLVVACSALRTVYREYLAAELPVLWIFLTGPEALIRRRLEQRVGHFVHPALLRSQLDVLEEPADALVVDVASPPREIVQQIIARAAAWRPLVERGGRIDARPAP